MLRYDMVFVPRPHPGLDLLGVSTVVPRAVPMAFVVAVLSRVVGAEVVQGVALWAIVALSVLGAGMLVPSRRPAARIAAGVLYAWNPLVYERILLGQWAFLLGYATLPWVAATALALRRGERAAIWRLLLALATAAVASPYTGVFAGVLAAFVALAPPWEETVPLRRACRVAVASLVANLPWLVPALLVSPLPTDAGLVTALFRARSDSPLGTVGSLASLGGLWRTDLAPPGRSGLAWIPAFAIVAGLCVVGWRLLGRRWPRGARAGLLALAGFGLVLAALPALPGLRPVATWLGSLPGGGILRDSQKFVVPLAVAGSVGFGLGVERALEELSGRVVRTLAIVLPLLPVALAPTLAWGAGLRLDPVSTPSSWEAVEAATSPSADAAPGAILVLPWHAHLPFGWNDGTVVRDPSPAAFGRRVVDATSLEVGKVRLPPEDPWSGLAEPVVLGSGPLAESLPSLGIRYVLVYREADWERWAGRLDGLESVLDEPDLSLYRVAGPATVPDLPTPAAAVVVAADVVFGLAVVLALVRVLAARRAARNDPGRSRG